MRTSLVATFAAALVAAFTTMGQTTPTAGTQVPAKLQRQLVRNGALDYLLYLPKGYGDDPAKKWPLILFLHGAGERGSDVQIVAKHGPPKVAPTKPAFPFIVVSPQCPEGQIWDDELLMGLLDEIGERYKVDASRVYLTGLSMGGYGTWSLGTRHPERFAAIAPICGGGQRIRIDLYDEAGRQALHALPVWAFHGAKDNVVPVSESVEMIDALKRAGCTNVKLTVYPEANHDSWTVTYGNAQLYDWFLSHQKGAPVK